MNIEEIVYAINECQELDEKGKFPKGDLLERLIQAKQELPKYEGILDDGSYRYYQSYLKDTVYIATGRFS